MRTDPRLRYAQVEIVGVRTLTGYDRNARTHSDTQVAQLAAAIDRFGFTQPLLVDERDVIIAGHGRLQAAKSLGMSEVPVIRIPGLSDAEKRALVLADNRIALNAGWDESMLAQELASLQASVESGDLDLEGGLEALGFGEAELREYSELLAPPPEKEEIREVMLGEDPTDACVAMREAVPEASPNRLVLAWGDALLGLDGAIEAAAELAFEHRRDAIGAIGDRTGLCEMRHAAARLARSA